MFISSSPDAGVCYHAETEKAKNGIPMSRQNRNGFLRTFGERGQVQWERWQQSLRRGIEDALFEKVKFRSAEHLSLE